MVYNSAARLVQDGLAALHHAREYVARRFPGCGQACGLLGAYALAIGFGDFLVEHFLLLQGKAFLLDLTPVFRRPNIGLYVPLVCYLIGCLAIIGGIGGAVLLTRWPTLRRWLGHCVGRLWPWLFGAALALPVFTSAHLAPLCGGLAAASLLVMWWLRDKTTGSRPFSMARGTAAAIATVLVLGAMSMMAAAWYPLRIGNDYIELDDSLKLPALDTSSAMSASINRSAAISCFIDEANREPDGSHAIPSWQRAHAKLTVPDVGCAALTDERNTDRVMNTLKVTGAWQSNAGRTLYHHAWTERLRRSGPAAGESG